MSLQIYLFFTGYKLKEAESKEVASVSGILNISHDFLKAETRSKYQTYVPRVEHLRNDECVDTYQYLKQRIDSSMQSFS